jgi:hypothetical protein
MNTTLPPSDQFANRVHVILASGAHGTRVASVYGTREQLRDIAERLNNALDSLPQEAGHADRPQSLFSIPATELSRVNPPAVLAFHVASSTSAKPKPWRGPMFGSLWALAFAVVGVVALVKWSLGLLP